MAVDLVLGAENFCKSLAPVGFQTGGIGPRVGRLVGGSYVLLEELGQGGMGKVFRARHVALDKTVAVKILSPQCLNESSFLRFQSEARLLGTLHHPAIVHVFDLGIDKSNLPFYAMELVEGRSLEELLEHGPLNIFDTIDIFISVLDALACAHNRGVVHRDVKPSNIVIASGKPGAKTDYKGRVKLLDFGISKLLGRDAQAISTRDEILGSPAYMSPEQIEGLPVDGRSDIYSVGCSIFETLTCVLPFDGSTLREIGANHLESRPPSLSEALPGHYFSESIEAVVAKCLAKNPDDRYQRVQELRADLQRIRVGRKVAATTATKGKVAKVGKKLAGAMELELEPESLDVPLAIGFESSLLLGFASLLFVCVGLMALVLASY